MSLPELNPCKCPTESKAEATEDRSTNFLNDPVYNPEGLTSDVEKISQSAKRSLPRAVELTPVPVPRDFDFGERIQNFVQGLDWRWVLGGGLFLVWVSQDRQKNIGS